MYFHCRQMMHQAWSKAFLATLVTLWYHLEGWQWGCCDNIPMLGCKLTYFATSPRSWYESCEIAISNENGLHGLAEKLILSCEP